MSKKSKERVPNYPADWEVTHEAKVNGRILTPGTEVKIRGERGRFRFVKAVRTPTVYWLDFVGGVSHGRHQIKMWRSFAPERVKTVHRIQVTRENNR